MNENQDQTTIYCSKQNCELEAVRLCRVCNQPFCIIHQSDLDESLCDSCPLDPQKEVFLSPESEASLETEQLPLVDANGVTHKGRDIYPIGEASQQTLPAIISQMSMPQLTEHVIKYKALLLQAEKMVDFRRIQLSMAQMEVLQREEIERRRVRGVRAIHPGVTGIKVGGVNTGKVNSWAAIAEKMKKAGITKEMIENAIRAKQKN